MIIQVDPTLLQSNSQQIQGIGGDISSLVKDLMGMAQGAPSYDGQFGPKVGEIGNEAVARGGGLSDVLNNLGEQLKLKGIQFATVDNAAISGLYGAQKDASNWLASFLFPASGGGQVALIQRYFSLGNLFNGKGIDLSFSALIAVILGTGQMWNGWTFFSVDQPSWWPSWLPRISSAPDTIVSPIPADEPIQQPKTTFGDLLKGPSPASSSAQLNSASASASTTAASPSAQTNPSPSTTPATSSYDVSYNVPTESQGTLNSSRACAPTSVSMVLNYYHAQNSANAGATTEQLLTPLKAGGKDISLTDMTGEIKNLGYQNISVKVNANMADLQSALKDGPVVVTTGVNLVGSSTVPRAITGPGTAYIHAMVVKGYNKDNVVVNDPWTGNELTFSTATFTKMWNYGSDGMYVIRP